MVPGSQFPTIEVSSLFVRPHFRRQGWAIRALEFLRDAAHEGGFRRVTLGTEWTNQRAVAFYLARGMYCRSWKHHIGMFFDRELPKWRVQVDGSLARFIVGDQVVGVAENRGDRLDWKLGDKVDKDFAWELEATASLQLAVMGWPIIRSDEAWQEQIEFGIAECGSFENLAFRIRQFERYHASQGWFVPRPNPSFATLVRLKSVSIKQGSLDVELSDGRVLPVTFELLDPMPDEDNPLESAHIEGNYVVCRVRSGKRDEFSVDRVLGWHQSPEHLETIIRYYREDRESRRRWYEKRRNEGRPSESFREDAETLRCNRWTTRSHDHR